MATQSRRVRQSIAALCAAIALTPEVGLSQARNELRSSRSDTGAPSTDPCCLAASEQPIPPPQRFVTHHTTTAYGQKVPYTAIAGDTYLTNLKGEITGSIFSFSYLKDGPRDPNRPVIFVFNGGPGSSSVWLHMGIFGPKRVVLSAEVNPSNLPPFGLQDNPYSMLDIADLVFIDPISTGYSRALGKGRNEDFYGVSEDADATAQFIQLWLSGNNRWTSPKFVIGESYGSLRASVLPQSLMGGQNGQGPISSITLNGVVLLGTSIGPRTERGAPALTDGPETALALNLPALADTAWYYQKVDRKGRSLEAFDAEATQFALGPYRDALRREAAGTLGASERKAIVDQLAGWTGLPPSVFEPNLEFDLLTASNRLVSDRGLNVGLYDSRYTLPIPRRVSDTLADDPAMGRYMPGFIATLNTMLVEDLGVKIDRPYVSIVRSGVGAKWRWDREGVPQERSYAEDLVAAMRRVPGMQVLVASGYYDLITPSAKARWDLEKAKPPADRVQFKVYGSGHMIYLGETAKAFSDDVRALVLRASRPVSD